MRRDLGSGVRELVNDCDTMALGGLQVNSVEPDAGATDDLHRVIHCRETLLIKPVESDYEGICTDCQLGYLRRGIDWSCDEVNLASQADHEFIEVCQRILRHRDFDRHLSTSLLMVI
jgi:hypothetical protein